MRVAVKLFAAVAIDGRTVTMAPLLLEVSVEDTGDQERAPGWERLLAGVLLRQAGLQLSPVHAMPAHGVGMVADLLREATQPIPPATGPVPVADPPPAWCPRCGGFKATARLHLCRCYLDKIKFKED